jgi:hypothetical protein
MAKRFETSSAFVNRSGLADRSTGPASGETVSKTIRFPLELWDDLHAELKARGMDASNGVRMIVSEWLRRERRR